MMPARARCGRPGWRHRCDRCRSSSSPMASRLPRHLRAGRARRWRGSCWPCHRQSDRARRPPGSTGAGDRGNPRGRRGGARCEHLGGATSNARSLEGCRSRPSGLERGIAMIPKFSLHISRSRLSRRRLLAATAAASTSLATARRFPAAAQTPVATPAAAAGPWHDTMEIPTNLAADASPRFRAVADALTQAMIKHGIPGAALGILMDGQEEHAVFGVANLETHEPVTPETLFQAGSITKTFTGTAIMRLIADGRLDLYAPVRAYLPDLDLADDSVAARVTIRHLLTHTAGWWGDAFFDTGDGEDAVARFVQERLPTLPQLFPLGMAPCYNNAAIV